VSIQEASVVEVEISLEQLAEAINKSHRAAHESAWAAVSHAVEAGQALLEARQRIDSGTFEDWVSANTEMAYATANRYMRLAFYKDELPTSDGLTSATHGVGINAAQKALRGLPPIPKVFGSNGPVATKMDIEVAKQMRDEGRSYRDIGEALGRNETTVYYWLNPKSRQRNRDGARSRRTAEREAFKRSERDKAVKRAGGDASHAYSHLRRCAADVQSAIDKSTDREQGAHLRTALDDLYRAEDQIMKALGIS